jgi:ribosomal protein L2
VVSIDHESSSITLKLPSGESRLFALTDRRVLGNISLGDHVTYELNEAGKIIRIVKLPTDPAN